MFFGHKVPQGWLRSPTHHLPKSPWFSEGFLNSRIRKPSEIWAKSFPMGNWTDSLYRKKEKTAHVWSTFTEGSNKKLSTLFTEIKPQSLGFKIFLSIQCSRPQYSYLNREISLDWKMSKTERCLPALTVYDTVIKCFLRNLTSTGKI